MADLFPGGRWPWPDELFSSWMAGTGLNHGMTLNALIEYLLGDCYFKRRDIDKFADALIVSRLASVTGTDLEKAQQTSLYLRALPISTFDKNVYTAQWVTHVNNIYTTRRTYGLCFCPLCFQEDKEPYYRVDWRLSFVTMCLKHECLLDHKCPHCNQEINLYRIPSTGEKLSICCWCGLDVSEAKEIKSSCFKQYIGIQTHLMSLLNEMDTSIDHEKEKVREYFLSLYYFCYMISQQCYKLEKRCVSIYQELSELLQSNELHFCFDAYTPIVRLIVLELAFNLYEQDASCNFKRHSQLYSRDSSKRIQLMKQVPCGRWCEAHDYLKISKSCRKFIAEALGQ